MTIKKKTSTALKKPSEKAIAISKKPSLVIKIPQGGQVIRTFHLTPSLPVDGKAANWLLVDPAKPNKDIDGMHFSFSPESQTLEQEFERAIVQIKIQQNTSDKGIWRFASDGVVVNPTFSETNHDVVIEIVDAGFTLLAQIQSVGTAPEDIRFGYLASFTDSESGLVTVYESSDPDIKVGRP